MATRRAAHAMHFVGANGFPAAMYKPVIREIEKAVLRKSHITETMALCGTTDVFGHVHGHDDWQGMIDAIIADVSSRDEGPVIGIGHSLGGALIAGAASARPDLFRSIICVDSPLFNPLSRIGFTIMYAMPKKLVYKHHPMIKMAKKKPDSWDSIDEAIDFFSSRKIFKAMDPEVFKLFIEECLVPNKDGNGGVSLLYSTDVEAEVYYKQPVDLPFHPRKKMNLLDFTCPATALYSDDHGLVSKRDLAWIKIAVRNMKPVTYTGTHFWPLEQPAAFAKKISELIMDSGHH